MYKSKSPLTLPVALGLPPALALALLSGCGSSGPRPDLVTGKYIAVLCDGDMAGTGFIDGQLGVRSGETDSLAVVTLPMATAPDAKADDWNTVFSNVQGVSNSAMGAPTSLASSKDGERVYVVETAGVAPAGATSLSQLPQGRTLTTVDLTNPASPAKLEETNVGAGPVSVAVRGDDSMVAVATREAGRQIVLFNVARGSTPELSRAMGFPLVGLPDATKPGSIAWHPGGNHLAVTIPGSNQVAMFEYRADGAGGNPGIAPWGEPVSVGKHPMSGVFSADGRFFIVNETHWGDDVEGYLAGAPAGTVSVVRVSDVGSAVTETGELDNARVRHEVVSTATVGVSPQAMAMSPDGKFVVTANLRRSMMPDAGDKVAEGGSLSLLRFDAATGELKSVGEFPLVTADGKISGMPEGVAFDASGKYVVVSFFRAVGTPRKTGELAFFRLETAGGGKLLPSTFVVGVGAGPHATVIVR